MCAQGGVLRRGLAAEALLRGVQAQARAPQRRRRRRRARAPARRRRQRRRRHKVRTQYVLALQKTIM